MTRHVPQVPTKSQTNLIVHRPPNQDGYTVNKYWRKKGEPILVYTNITALLKISQSEILGDLGDRDIYFGGWQDAQLAIDSGTYSSI